MSILLEAGSDLEARNVSGDTPLQASMRNHPEEQIDVIQILVPAGADVNTRNNLGETPLHAEALAGSVVRGD